MSSIAIPYSQDFLLDGFQDNIYCYPYESFLNQGGMQVLSHKNQNPVMTKYEDIDYDPEPDPVFQYDDFFCMAVDRDDDFLDQYHTMPTKRFKMEDSDGVYAVPVSPGMEELEEVIKVEKPRKTPPPPVINSIPATPVTTPSVANNNNSLVGSCTFKLVMGQQPSPSVVYKRIVKPFPAVMLLEESTFSNTSRLFVDVQLIREDNGKVADIIEGNQPLPISNGIYTVFKKLKIKETSRVHKTKFRLKFRLVQSKDKTYVPVSSISVMSDPISVYSHSSYVSKSKSSVGPPVATEIFPSSVSKKGGTRCVLLGSNFVKSKHLRIKIGDVELEPTFHESGTLVFTTPQLTNPGRISVTNDSIDYALSNLWVSLTE
jgi:hypothetical protein